MYICGDLKIDRSYKYNSAFRMEDIILEKFAYDKEVYNLHTVKREFKKQKLSQVIDKYKLIDEVYFVKQIADLDSEPNDYIGPSFRKPFELLALINCMLTFPPVYLKLINYSTLNVMLIKVLYITTDITFYPLCYVKLYLPDCDKVRVMIKVYNPHTDYTKYIINIIVASNQKQIVEYINNLNSDYVSGKIDFNTISRTFLDFSDAISAISEGW
jgi:hypothetical protein